jgi:hypothetical protein
MHMTAQFEYFYINVRSVAYHLQGENSLRCTWSLKNLKGVYNGAAGAYDGSV